MKHNIIKNFLPKNVFKKVHDKLFSETFSWYLAHDVVSYDAKWSATCEDIYNWQLIHNFYESPATFSQEINIMNSVMKIIDPRLLIRIKANIGEISKPPIEGINLLIGSRHLFEISFNNKNIGLLFWGATQLRITEPIIIYKIILVKDAAVWRMEIIAKSMYSYLLSNSE